MANIHLVSWRKTVKFSETISSIFFIASFVDWCVYKIIMRRVFCGCCSSSVLQYLKFSSWFLLLYGLRKSVWSGNFTDTLYYLMQYIRWLRLHVCNSSSVGLILTDFMTLESLSWVNFKVIFSLPILWVNSPENGESTLSEQKLGSINLGRFLCRFLNHEVQARCV